MTHTRGNARCGRIRTPHGVIETPAFMPVGTRATVKGLSPAQLRDTHTQIVLANTYHLMLRPGSEVVAHFGGLHKFMGWDGPILTDSGGFQVFSLADLRRLDDDGVEFRSHIDGAAIHLSPESSIKTQNELGADIIMAFDECPPLPAEGAAIMAAVRRTAAWAKRSRAAHTRPEQALYGIVQGGLDVSLRRECLERLVEIGFEGYAVGGLSVGEPPAEMYALLDEFTHELPAERPRYLMGVGRPLDLVRGIAAGIDQFDCVLPTRNGRKAYAFTSQGVLRMRNQCHQLADEPLDPACACYTCANFSRGYLRHLCMSGELLGSTLISLHNIAFYQDLMRQARTALESDEFDTWRAAFSDSPASCRCEEPT
ncbi:MAG: tRNA guanosine(34) transglycosylase Tgt [Phycisphaerae bacterium]|nr:tRNA guanosine(34) transglycosylase Tgt [Phycisphaerae bacterium]